MRQMSAFDGGVKIRVRQFCTEEFDRKWLSLRS